MGSVLLQAEHLYPTKNDVPESVRTQLIVLLNQLLADAVDLQTQAKGAHWNVKGPNFIALHKLFDEVHASVAEYVDLLAERAVQLGGVAEGTARTVARRSDLEEYPAGIADGSRHVEALSSALATFGAGVRRAIDEASGLGDQGTADLFTEVSRGIDKWLWFVEAHSQSQTS
jgi:starvation-inducible DNA-binding protein